MFRVEREPYAPFGQGCLQSEVHAFPPFLVEQCYFGAGSCAVQEGVELRFELVRVLLAVVAGISAQFQSRRVLIDVQVHRVDEQCPVLQGAYSQPPVYTVLRVTFEAHVQSVVADALQVEDLAQRVVVSRVEPQCHYGQCAAHLFAVYYLLFRLPFHLGQTFVECGREMFQVTFCAEVQIQVAGRYERCRRVAAGGKGKVKVFARYAPFGREEAHVAQTALGTVGRQVAPGIESDVYGSSQMQRVLQSGQLLHVDERQFGREAALQDVAERRFQMPRPFRQRIVRLEVGLQYAAAQRRREFQSAQVVACGRESVDGRYGLQPCVPDEGVESCAVRLKPPAEASQSAARQETAHRKPLCAGFQLVGLPRRVERGAGREASARQAHLRLGRVPVAAQGRLAFCRQVAGQGESRLRSAEHSLGEREVGRLQKERYGAFRFRPRGVEAAPGVERCGPRYLEGEGVQCEGVHVAACRELYAQRLAGPCAQQRLVCQSPH